MASKVNVNEEILKAADVQPKRNEDRQVFLQRAVRAVADLDDKAWEGLSSEAQDWYNEAADQMNAKKPIIEMPGFEEADEGKKEEAAAPARRRGAEPKEEAKKDDEPELADPKVGDTVKLKTKRGEEFEGKITEIDDDEIVIDVDGEDEAFRRSKVESIQIVGGKKAEKTERKAEDEPKADKEDAPKADKPKREPPKRDPSKKPVTQRMRELICENDEADKAEISKMLKDEGLEFRDATLDIMFADTQKTIQTLKDLKRFK